MFGQLNERLRVLIGLFNWKGIVGESEHGSPFVTTCGSIGIIQPPLNARTHSFADGTIYAQP